MSLALETVATLELFVPESLYSLFYNHMKKIGSPSLEDYFITALHCYADVWNQMELSSAECSGFSMYPMMGISPTEEKVKGHQVTLQFTGNAKAYIVNQLHEVGSEDALMSAALKIFWLARGRQISELNNRPVINAAGHVLN